MPESNEQIKGAVDFLMSWPSINITAINPASGKISGMSITKDDTGRAKCAGAIAGAQSKGAGVYFSVNGLKPPLGPGRPKANENEVNALHAFHVDADVSKDITDSTAFAKAKAELLTTIEAMKPAPTTIIDSGNGFGLFWALRTPVIVTRKNRAELKAINVALRDLVRAMPGGSADACQNLDRVMRVPGTVNFPNEAKRKRGRVEVMATLIWDRRDPDLDRLYTVEDFAELVKPQAEPQAPPEGDIPEMPDTVDMSRLDGPFRELIEKNASGRKFGDGSRSALAFYVAAKLIEGGFSDGEIVWILTNPDFAVSAHLLRDERTRDPHVQAIKIIRDAKAKGARYVSAQEDFSADPVEFTAEETQEAEAAERAEHASKNAKARFARVLDEYVLCLDPVAFIRRADKVALGPGQFDARYNPIVNFIPGLATRYRDHAAKFAMGRDLIERVDGMCYRPGGDSICEHRFNMWVDPQIDPLDGKPTIFLEHMNYLIPDQREREILLDWLAWLVQHPDQKIMFAVLIVGYEGTGKSWLGYMLRKLFGDSNVAMVENEDPIGDTFNGWTENKRLGFIHELAPDPKIDLVSRVKGIITESHIWVNEKYIKRHRSENQCHLLAVTNHETSVRMLRSNRRWFVIRAADDPMHIGAEGEPTPECSAYYKRLFDAIGPNNDLTPTAEVRRILRWLQQRDVSKFAIAVAPPTETKHEMADTVANGIASQVAELYRAQVEPFKNRTLVTPAEVVACIDVGRQYRRDDPNRTLGSLALASAAMSDLGCRKVTDLVRIGGGDRARLWATTRALGKKYKAMNDADVVAIYKAERAKADKAAKAEAIKTAAADFEAE